MNQLKRALVGLVAPLMFLLATAFPAAAVEVGQKAPEFELESTKGGKLKLSDLRGKNVLINFYRADFDPT
jgi:cytochrome oxidase Cu insertion factor (SCO1/SenC/PrrC family)